MGSFEKAASTREIRGLIGRQLKAHYDLTEPIPDRLAELLKQLAQRSDERESESGKV
jgi:Anti-sigma factor NepR